jgi:hypothetical protein
MKGKEVETMSVSILRMQVLFPMWIPDLIRGLISQPIIFVSLRPKQNPTNVDRNLPHIHALFLLSLV